MLLKLIMLGKISIQVIYVQQDLLNILLMSAIKILQF